MGSVASEWRRDVPEWTRRIWTAPEARDVWRPRISAVSRAFQEAEWRSVIEGARPAALLSVQPEDLSRATRRAQAHGLAIVPLTRTGTAGSYSASPRPVEDGPWHYRAALTRPELTSSWWGAWERSDNDAIGELLGYPHCCRTFFRRVWVDRGWCDTTWAMVEETEGTVEVECDHRNNILLRWLGVRAVPHLPCAFDCEATRELADTMIGLVREPEQLWLREMLAWPVEWSALHGIAEIKTPVVKVSTKTEWTPEKIAVQKQGDAYPESGATGTVFPYLSPVEKRMREKGRPDPKLWQDNGFSSRDAMERSHAPLVELAGAYANGGPVVDLGCGNGRLLSEIASDGYGVEIDAERSGRAVEGVEVRSGDFLSDTETWAGKHDLVVLMPGRLTEREVEGFEQALRERTDHVLAYAYGDWLERYGSLEKLMEEAGIGGDRIKSAAGDGVEAAVYCMEEGGCTCQA